MEMRPMFQLFSSRRAFLSGIAALAPVVFLGHPRLSHAARADLKSLVSQLELESLKSGRPRRSQAFRCSQSGEGVLLWTESEGEKRPACVLNRTGEFIWRACDGCHTVDEISQGVHEKFLVSRHRARADVLGFLWSLKVRGAVQ
jgi:hypothetical protein